LVAVKTIEPDKLQIGMHVILDLSWWKHPFVRNSFKIQSEKQLEIIRSLGLDAVKYDPDQSEYPSDDAPKKSPGEKAAPSEKMDQVDIEAARIKAKKLKFLKIKQEKLRQCDRKYNQSLAQVNDITKEISAGNFAGVEKAKELVDEVVETLQGDTETMVHLLNLKEMDRVAYFHSLNVSILSLILGRDLGLTEMVLRDLGIGALIHDIGKTKIPKKVLLKKTPLSAAEQKYMRMHPIYGYEMAHALPNLSQNALDTIMQHHERITGSGYPKKLRGEEIQLNALITAIADLYDNLCNSQTEKRLTPHEAVAILFHRYRDELPRNLLDSFIKSVGVYPPGTLVELSGGARGMVISSDKKKGMKPTVLVYAQKEPITGPIILDLSEETLDVDRTLRREELEPEERAYLRADYSVGFYIHSKS